MIEEKKKLKECVSEFESLVKFHSKNASSDLIKTLNILSKTSK